MEAAWQLRTGCISILMFESRVFIENWFLTPLAEVTPNKQSPRINMREKHIEMSFPLGARNASCLHVYPLWWWHSSHSSLLNPSSFSSFPQALGIFSHALGSASTGFFYTRFSFVTLDPWGASPFLFFHPLAPVSMSLHLLLIHLLSSRLSLFLPPPPIPAYASCVTSFSSSSPSSSRTMFCAVSFLSWHHLSLCVFV